MANNPNLLNVLIDNKTNENASSLIAKILKEHGVKFIAVMNDEQCQKLFFLEGFSALLEAGITANAAWAIEYSARMTVSNPDFWHKEDNDNVKLFNAVAAKGYNNDRVTQKLFSGLIAQIDADNFARLMLKGEIRIGGRELDHIRLTPDDAAQFLGKPDLLKFGKSWNWFNEGKLLTVTKPILQK